MTGMVTLVAMISASLLAAPKAPAPAFRLQTVKVESKGRFEAEASYPIFSSKSELAKVANQLLQIQAGKILSAWTKEVDQDFLPKGSPLPPNPYGFDLDPSVESSGPSLISVVSTVYTYTGGAHPNRYFVASNFGVVKGKAKQIQIGDLFRPGFDYLQEITMNVMPELVRREAGWVESGWMREVDATRANIFTVNAKGITFYFEPYSAGSYAEGEYIVTVPFSEFTGLDRTGPLRQFRW